MSKKPGSVDAYIGRYPKDVQTLLRKMRATVKKAAPRAQELISYGVPAYTFHGSLVWFAAFKHHIGLYPRASGISAFKKELEGFKQAKGSVQFPLNKPLPLALVARIVKFRVKENLHKSEEE